MGEIQFRRGRLEGKKEDGPAPPSSSRHPIFFFGSRTSSSPSSTSSGQRRCTTTTAISRRFLSHPFLYHQPPIINFDHLLHATISSTGGQLRRATSERHRRSCNRPQLLLLPPSSATSSPPQNTTVSPTKLYLRQPTASDGDGEVNSGQRLASGRRQERAATTAALVSASEPAPLEFTWDCTSDTDNELRQAAVDDDLRRRSTTVDEWQSMVAGVDGREQTRMQPQTT